MKTLHELGLREKLGISRYFSYLQLLLHVTIVVRTGIFANKCNGVFFGADFLLVVFCVASDVAELCSFTVNSTG
jgi:hypothetical protein